ncbi:hypothetical protein [Accumulibacter sp.]|jgi:hypothetical protein|uniref:hypothetical protein n=1 Tax=Accumulibacter sp. TaxID=2053492 RepID=UPI002C7F8C98|nr:hypothetical protein [Accumulibacter sp.]HPU80622.1 hypothetical protein [Accumulibacter sp.]
MSVNCRVPLLAFLLLPMLANGACTTNDTQWLWNYSGSIGEKYRIGMTLVLAGSAVSGSYFYASQLADIRLRGRIAHGTDIVLDELDAADKVVARFVGRFLTSDPSGRYQGDKLECEIITGTWHKLDANEGLPVRLTLENGTAGSLANRYAVAGATDDERVHRQALRFWHAVKRADKPTVAALLAYPLNVVVAGSRKRINDAKELIGNYDAIFSPQMRAAIGNALPRNMFVRDQGIMLGNGEVWFGADGRVIALNPP